MSYTYAVLARPFSLGATNSKLEITNFAGTLSSIQTLAAGPHINQGNVLASGPNDFVAALETAAAAGIAAVGVGGTWTPTITNAGQLTWKRSGGGPSDKFYIRWDTANSILSDYAGEDTTDPKTLFENDHLSPYIVYGRWHAGVDEDYDSGDHQLIVARETRSLTGRPSRVRYGSGAPPADRILQWSRVMSARVKQARADDAAYAAVVGFTPGDDATLESWKLDLLDDPGPYDDSRVYIYDTNVVLAAARSAPYLPVWGESRPGLDGVPLEGYRRGDQLESYEVALRLWRDPV